MGTGPVPPPRHEVLSMLDLLFVGLTLLFFAVCFGYVAWCDRLMK